MKFLAVLPSERLVDVDGLAGEKILWALVGKDDCQDLCMSAVRAKRSRAPGSRDGHLEAHVQRIQVPIGKLDDTSQVSGHHPRVPSAEVATDTAPPEPILNGTPLCSSGCWHASQDL